MSPCETTGMGDFSNIIARVLAKAGKIVSYLYRIALCAGRQSHWGLLGFERHIARTLQFSRSAKE